MDRIKHKKDQPLYEEIHLQAGHQAHPAEELLLLNEEAQVPIWTEALNLIRPKQRLMIIVHGQINPLNDHTPDLQKTIRGPLPIRMFNDQLKDQQGIQISEDLRGALMFVARQEVLTLNDLQEVPVFNDPPEAQRRVVRLVVQTLSDQMEIPV